MAASKADNTGLLPLRRSLFARCRRFRDHRDAIGWAGREQSQQLSQVPIQLEELVRILLEKRLGIFPALPDALALERIPGAAFLDEVVRRAQIEQIAFT